MYIQSRFSPVLTYIARRTGVRVAVYLELAMTITLPRVPTRENTRLTNPYHAIKNLALVQQALFWSGWLVSSQTAPKIAD